MDDTEHPDPLGFVAVFSPAPSEAGFVGSTGRCCKGDFPNGFLSWRCSVVSTWVISVLFCPRWGTDGPVFPIYGKKTDESRMYRRLVDLPSITALCASDEGKLTRKC